MAEFLKRLILAGVLLVATADSQLFEGDECKLTNELTGQRGVCTPLQTCPPARQGIKKKIFPQTCSFVGTSPIVCCPPSATSSTTSAPPPTDPPPSTVAPPPTSTAVTSTTASLYKPPSKQCDPLPELAIKVQRTGQKAWDKCIELAEYVYPCVASSFLIDSPKIRRNTCQRKSKTLIVGGTSASQGEFPHMAALGFGEQPPQTRWLCGGTLISEKWIMTAGHCTFDRDEGEEVKYAMLGGDNIDSPVNPLNLYTIIRIETHPDYDPPIKYNDIALLQLDRRVVFTDFIRPACLHTGNPVNDSEGITTGWGTTQSNGNRSTTLLKVTLEKFSYNECSFKNPPSKLSKDGIRNATQICYGHHTEKKDTCQGDSGGPAQVFNDHNVYCTYLVIGITSFGRDCAIEGQPAPYTRVAAFVPWIESIVWP